MVVNCRDEDGEIVKARLHSADEIDGIRLLLITVNKPYEIVETELFTVEEHAALYDALRHNPEMIVQLVK